MGLAWVTSQSRLTDRCPTEGESLPSQYYNPCPHDRTVSHVSHCVLSSTSLSLSLSHRKLQRAAAAAASPAAAEALGIARGSRGCSVIIVRPGYDAGTHTCFSRPHLPLPLPHWGFLVPLLFPLKFGDFSISLICISCFICFEVQRTWSAIAYPRRGLAR